MAEDHGPQDRSKHPRREGKPRFGRSAKLPQKPSRSILQWIGVIALLAAFAVVTIKYGPSYRTRTGFFHDWFTHRREAQEQREIAVELQHIQQIKRDAEALRLKSKGRIEVARREIDKRIQSLQQLAPQQTQTERRP